MDSFILGKNMKKMMKLNIQLFASNSASKVVYAPASSQYGYNIGVSWNESNPSDVNNTSVINITGTLLGSKINFSQAANNTLAIFWFDDNANTNGKQVAIINIASTVKGTTYSVNGSLTVTHKPDGSLNGHARAVFTKNGSNSYVPPTTNVDTGNTVLQTIPRATNCPAESLIVGKTNVIALSPASDSFYHKMTFAIGNTTFTSTSGKNSISIDLTATSIYNLFSTKSIEAEATLTTYSDSNLSNAIGTSKNKVVISVNEDIVRPTITATYKDTNSTIVAITGSNQTIVKNKSTLEITMNATPHYSTIKNYIVNGIEQGNNTKYITSSPISNKYTYQATDNRGISSEQKELNISKFIDYISPVASVEFTRNGPTTGKVKVKYSGIWFNGSIGNTVNVLTVKYKYKKLNESTWSNAISLTPTKNGNTFSGEVELSGNFDYKTIYNFKLIVTDKLESNSFDDIVPRGEPDYWSNGKKMKILVDLYIKGKSLIDYSYPVGSIYTSVDSSNPSAKFGGSWVEIISSDLIASGKSSSGVNYRVYSDGFVEYFGYDTVDSIGPYASVWKQIQYPFTVINDYTYGQISKKVGGEYWSWVDCSIDNSTPDYATIPVYNNSSVGTAKNVTFSYRIVSKINLENYKDTFGSIPKRWKRIS